MIEGLYVGLIAIISVDVILALCAGIAIGYMVGSLPGLTTAVGMAVVLPFTFAMDPVSAMVMLVAIYVAGDYAAAIPGILVNAPGQPAAAITAFDGYPMRLQGKAGEALTLSILSSGFGAFVSTLLLIVSAAGLAHIALAFGPAEYFALSLLGLALVTSLASGSMTRAVIGLVIGLMVVTIGLDPISGTQRYVFHRGLIEGVPFLPALIGLFALSEVFMMLERSLKSSGERIQSLPSPWKSIPMIFPYGRTLGRSSIIGFLIGVVPGAGATIASLVSYSVSKRLSKQPDSFGTGNPEGVVASETANNAAGPGALAPLLSLGIPGSASAAILIGALMIHGINPGPMLFARNPEIPYAIFVSLLIGLPVMMLIGLLGTRFWVQITRLSPALVSTVVTSVCLLGAYTYDNNILSVWVTVVAGIIGYVLRKLNIHPAPIILALVLGSMMESNLRRGLRVSGDDFSYFISKPLSAIILFCAFAVFVLPMAKTLVSVFKSKRFA
jgi:putative tricarboxylic transport membrane protein